EQRLQERPPHPPGRVQLELPALRREPEHRRADRPQRPPGRRRPDDLPRRRLSVAHRAAGYLEWLIGGAKLHASLLLLLSLAFTPVERPGRRGHGAPRCPLTMGVLMLG